MFPTVHGIVSQGGAGTPFVPPPIPVTPDGIWLETLFIAQVDDTDVTAWADASAAGYDLASTRTHPKFRTNVTPSGAPVIRANEASRLDGTGTFYDTGTDPFTLFMTASTDATDNNHQLLSLRTGNGSQPVVWYRGATNNHLRFSHGGSAIIQTGSGLADGVMRVFTIRFNPSDTGTDRLRGWTDKSLFASANETALNGTSNRLCVLGQGGSNSFGYEGDVAAILWYRSALSDGNREAIIDYLTDRYITPTP